MSYNLGDSFPKQAFLFEDEQIIGMTLMEVPRRSREVREVYLITINSRKKILLRRIMQNKLAIAFLQPTFNPVKFVASTLGQEILNNFSEPPQFVAFNFYYADDFCTVAFEGAMFLAMVETSKESKIKDIEEYTDINHSTVKYA